MSRRRAGLVAVTIAALASLAGAATLLTGCGGGGGVTDYTNQPGWTLDNSNPVLDHKMWTVLVYMNAANNLDPDSVANMNQLQAIGSDANVNVVVQWKRQSSWNGATRRYYIAPTSGPGSVASPAPILLSENANLDMGSAASLRAFGQWGVKAFPATHYCLVIWDHGAGWRAETPRTTSRAASTRGISYDNLTGDHIDTTQMGSAIQLAGGQQWDLLAMDASLMQMAEVDYEMRNQTHYIVGSEESPPELGYPYNTLLSDLEANYLWDGKSLGIDIAKQTLTYYTVNSDVTQSVIDTSGLAALPGVVDALGKALSAAPATDASQITTAENTAESVDSGDYAGYYRDVYDFAHLLADSGAGVTPVADPGVQSAAQAVKTSLNSIIVYNAHGNQHPNMYGLTIYLPTPANYAAIAAQQAAGQGPGGGSLEYTSLDFVQAAPDWNSFLVSGPQ